MKCDCDQDRGGRLLDDTEHVQDGAIKVNESRVIQEKVLETKVSECYETRVSGEGEGRKAEEGQDEDGAQSQQGR